MLLQEIAILRNRKTGRCSSWDRAGRNADAWVLEPGESRVLADLKGPGQITHLWMTQSNHYRECVLKMTWDNAAYPSVWCPLGDFFGLGHGMVNSYQSCFFSASTRFPYRFDAGCALNAYLPMPFRERARVELVNESREPHRQYFYVDYETLPDWPENAGCLHAEFRRANPFGGWGPEIRVNTPEADIANKGWPAWDHNYVILETRGRGHYIGCNLSVANLCGGWWGEGDDMIWVDGYKWPPDLHGTGTEDYFNQAWGMQNQAFLRNGSSLFEGRTTLTPSECPWPEGAYQTSYVFHVENPVRFQKEIRVTLEHGHGNHLANDMASVAYWYADRPTRAAAPPSVEKRRPVLRDRHGRWQLDRNARVPGRPVPLTAEMRRRKAAWARRQARAR